MKKRKILTRLLILCLILPAAHQLQAAESGSDGANATSTLQSVKEGLAGFNNFVGLVGASQAQTQALAAQLSGIYNRGNVINQNLSSFQQVAGSLSMALAEAQGCVQKAQASQKKYKNANIPATAIASTEATCKNAANLIDSIKAQNDQLDIANKKMGCIRDFQNKVNQIAEQAKKPFKDLTMAAQEKWESYDQVINIYKQMADQMDEDLNGQNGYRKKLDALKKLSMQLNDAINANPKKGGSLSTSSGETLDTALGRKIEELKKKRNGNANALQKMIISDTIGCMSQDATIQCDNLGFPTTPLDCISRGTNKTAANNSAVAAQNEANKKQLQQALTQMFGELNRAAKGADIDIKNQESFERYSRTMFANLNQQMSATLAARKFYGSVDSHQLAAVFSAQMNFCYNNAMTNYETGMKSENNPYKSLMDEITTTEADVYNEAKKWIDVVSEQMNEFRTSFNKVYNNDIPQFNANCTAAQDAYQSVDCLRVMSATLKAGIEGTTQSVKLNDGSFYTADEGITTLNVPTLSNDASGKPTSSTTAVQCRGFNECFNYLDSALTYDRKQVQQYSNERDQFVSSHNKAVNDAMATMAAPFAGIGTLMNAAVQELNGMLTSAGVSATVKTKQVEGESLQRDETTKLYKMPSNMKAAFASQGSYTELDDTAEVTQAMNTRRAALNRKAGEAFKMKSACTVAEADYKAVASSLPKDCSKVCDGSRQARPIGVLEKLVLKSGVKIDKDAQNPVSKKYNDCIREAKNDIRDEAEYASASYGTPDYSKCTDASTAVSCKAQADMEASVGARRAKAEQLARRQAAMNEQAQVCREDAIQSLSALNANSRDDELNKRNGKIIQMLSELDEACPDKDRAKYACEELKDYVNGIKISSDEPEEDSGSSNPMRDAK